MPLIVTVSTHAHASSNEPRNIAASLGYVSNNPPVQRRSSTHPFDPARKGKLQGTIRRMFTRLRATLLLPAAMSTCPGTSGGSGSPIQATKGTALHEHRDSAPPAAALAIPQTCSSEKNDRAVQSRYSAVAQTVAPASHALSAPSVCRRTARS